MVKSPWTRFPDGETFSIPDAVLGVDGFFGARATSEVLFFAEGDRVRAFTPTDVRVAEVELRGGINRLYDAQGKRILLGTIHPNAGLADLWLWEVANVGTGDLDKAQQALITFFDLLHDQRYVEAIRYYGGSYDVLRDWNPTVPEDDYAMLFKMGCMVNGLQCLPVKRIVHSEQVSPTEFVFVVEFMNEDGSLFVRGPCCGATEAEMPPQSQFTFTVMRVDDRFLVQELPVLVP